MAVAHRLCKDNSHFTDDPLDCLVRNDIVFAERNLTLEEIYPSQLCWAFNMTVPCPVPEIGLKSVMIGGPDMPDAMCPYLPTIKRLLSFRSEDWHRLVDSMLEMEAKNRELERAERPLDVLPDVDVEASADGSVESVLGAWPEAPPRRGRILTLRPYIWKDPACRELLQAHAPPDVVERIRNVAGGALTLDDRKRLERLGSDKRLKPKTRVRVFSDERERPWEEGWERSSSSQKKGGVNITTVLEEPSEEQHPEEPQRSADEHQKAQKAADVMHSAQTTTTSDRRAPSASTVSELRRACGGDLLSNGGGGVLEQGLPDFWDASREHIEENILLAGRKVKIPEPCRLLLERHAPEGWLEVLEFL